METKNKNGRELFSNLADDIINSELTDEQIAYLTLLIHRMLTEEIEKAKNTILAERSTIKSERAYTKTELATKKKCNDIKLYSDTLKNIKKVESDSLMLYASSIFNPKTKNYEKNIVFFRNYYIDECFMKRNEIEEKMQLTNDSLSGDYSGSNVNKMLAKKLRGFESRK